MNQKSLGPEIISKAKTIKLLLMDCDGVLTDGKLYFSKDGEELKVFNVKDGQGINLWHKAGFLSGVITGRQSKMLEKRVKELKINFLKQKSADKIADLKDILKETNLLPSEVAFIGDDISDLELLKVVGFPVAVSDAVEELFPEVIYITNQKGGEGAVREVIKILLEYR
jgi:3-deoxy-D-manno-octulosonate 8-phosphate phosphatase (KDO 8-P phosphatase)